MSNQNLFKWRHFQAEIIVLCVRWYLRYALSYRDLEEIMAERGLLVDHRVVLQERERKQDEQRMAHLVQFRQALQTTGQPMQPDLGCLLCAPLALVPS